ncbi:MAG: PspA/IM30 family protein [Oscillatoriales cyanobacterium]|nr:MAG: PspA/IM30 family protein [Oscillatoriales cyanobacterium]TAH17227.1 MAG: PspA/IM30 family protein [Oscillatoriales cyanobacterium]
MGLFDRLWLVIRANINSLVGAAEDPEKILEQATMDMQEDLVQLRQAVAGAIAAQKRTERQHSQAESTAQEWYQRAQLALQKGEDNLAREALTRKKFYQETATAMKASLDQQNVIVGQLKDNMRGLETKIFEAKSKKDMYIARVRSAAASERLQEMMGNLSTGSAVSAFERMEEKVMQLEARSEAIAELGTNDLEKKFLALESGGDVDGELAAMKAQMLGGNNTPKLRSGEQKSSID